jgi:large subunit ribosomal protein L25
MKHPLLKAEKRTVLGKQVKKLRREGFLPANVYGKNLASVALQVKMVDFEKIFKEVGETGLVDLEFDGKAKPVLIKNLQMNFQSHSPLHADFYQVNLKEKIKTMIPLLLVGEAQAVTDKAGMLQQNLSEVEVEALPEKLPENIEVSIEHLAAVGDGITVADLKAPADVVILSDETQTIVKIAELVAPEPEPEAEAEEAAEGEEGATEGAEGETAAEGEAATEEKPAEETTE